MKRVDNYFPVIIIYFLFDIKGSNWLCEVVELKVNKY